MATTQKGIYYPDDYTAIADVPEDMKDLAESVDTALENLEDNIEQNIQPQIDDIEEEQTTQNNNIEALQIENTRLKATLPTTTGTGENITLSNTAELDFIQPPLPRGNSEQVQYSGKNLFDLKGFLTDRNIQFTENNDGSLTFDIAYSAYSNVLEFSEEDIAVSLGGIITNVTSSNVRIILLNKSGSVVGTKYSDTSDLTNLSACKLRFDYTSLGTVTMKNIMLNAGATVEPYEPYVGGTASPNPSYPQAITNVTGDVEVLVQNKNLINLQDKTETTVNGITYNIKNGIITLNGEATNNGYTFSRLSLGKFKAGTYTVKKLSYSNASGSYSLSLLYSTTIDYGNGLNQITQTITLTEDTILYLSLWSNSGTKFNNSEIKFQIEQGSTSTSYVEHKEQTFTFPLGTQRMFLGDYLADDGIHHPIRGQITLDGTENFENWTSGTNTIGFRLTNVNNLKDISSSTTQFILLSNCFVASTSQNALANNDLERIATTNGNLYFRIKKTTASDLAGFKTWLSTHNVTVEYELAEEEITPYTTEQQQAYDEIKQALSYEEQTNISGSSDEINPLFSVEAYQSIKLILAS